LSSLNSSEDGVYKSQSNITRAALLSTSRCLHEQDNYYCCFQESYSCWMVQL